MQYHILNLSTHQGSVLETYGDIAAAFAREGTQLDADLTADISAQASTFDSTNACVFNSIAIAEWIRQNQNTLQLPMNCSTVQKAVEEIMIRVPQLINDVRDSSLRYTVDEALEVLSYKGSLGRGLQAEEVMMLMAGVTTQEGKDSLFDCLKNLHP